MGGVPVEISYDNLKTAVKRYCRAASCKNKINSYHLEPIICTRQTAAGPEEVMKRRCRKSRAGSSQKVLYSLSGCRVF